MVVLFCSHGNKEVFSCLGIQLAVDWFVEKGHKDITVFVPAWRKEQSRPDAPITGTKTLLQLATFRHTSPRYFLKRLSLFWGEGGCVVCVNIELNFPVQKKHPQ